MILDIKSIEEKERTREIVHRLIGSKKQIEKDMIADLQNPKFCKEVEKLKKRNAKRGTPIVQPKV